MKLLRKCMCFDLRTGSALVGLLRFIHWIILLSCVTYVWSQLFLLENGGILHLKARTNIENNGEFQQAIC